MEGKPSGSRLLKARFNSKYTELTVIVCYAPIEDQLQAVTDKVPTHDLLMVLGDLNARPANNNIGRDCVMGKHGIGTINDNGDFKVGTHDGTSPCNYSLQLVAGTSRIV